MHTGLGVFYGHEGRGFCHCLPSVARGIRKKNPLSEVKE